MLVVALKPGHDGAIAAIEDDRLLFSLESEKDSFPRHAQRHAEHGAGASLERLGRDAGRGRAGRLDQEPRHGSSSWARGYRGFDLREPYD